MAIDRSARAAGLTRDRRLTVALTIWRSRGAMMKPLLVLAGFLLAGCSPRADQVFIVPGALVTGSSGAQPGYAVKLVRAKEAPSEVIGDDDSRCRLTAERFAGVDVGDWLACEWTITPDTAATIERTGA